MLGHSRKKELPPLALRGRRFVWGARTYMMGIINATPDSFSGDGIGADEARAVERARVFAQAGCDVIDIGGESTRPGHVPVSANTEAQRVLGVIAAVRAAVSLPISIDTFKPQVAAAALEAGADIVNCVWGAVPGIVEIAAHFRAPLVVMHNRAEPYDGDDCVRAIIESLSVATREAEAAGIDPARIIVDPGIGFGKMPDQNVEIIGRLSEFVDRLPYPLLVGTSRKSFIGKITGRPVDDRVYGTAASIALAIAAGVDMVRVHDVEELVAAVDVADAVCRTRVASSGRALAQEIETAR